MTATIIDTGPDYVAVECKQRQNHVKQSPLQAHQHSVRQQDILGPSELHEMLMPDPPPLTLKSYDQHGNREGQQQTHPKRIRGIPHTPPQYTSHRHRRHHLPPLTRMVSKQPGPKPRHLPPTITSSHGVSLR